MLTAHAALRRGTHIFSWGRGDLGQLGTELDQSQSQPVLVQAVEDKDVAHVGASAFNSAFVTGTVQAPDAVAGSIHRRLRLHLLIFTEPQQ